MAVSCGKPVRTARQIDVISRYLHDADRPAGSRGRSLTTLRLKARAALSFVARQWSKTVGRNCGYLVFVGVGMAGESDGLVG